MLSCLDLALCNRRQDPPYSLDLSENLAHTTIPEPPFTQDRASCDCTCLVFGLLLGIKVPYEEFGGLQLLVK